MRYTIWQKDDYFEIIMLDGTHLYQMDARSVLFGEEVEIFLGYNTERSHVSIGHLRDIRVENDTITGEVTWSGNVLSILNDEIMKEQGLRLGGVYTNVKKNEKDDRVVSCSLSEVMVLYTNDMTPWPRGVNQYEYEHLDKSLDKQYEDIAKRARIDASFRDGLRAGARVAMAESSPDAIALYLERLGREKA